MHPAPPYLPLQKMLALAVACAGVMVGLPSSARAQAPAAPTVIYACVVSDGVRDGNPNDGRLLRLVSANERCRPREVKISWNQMGPAGPAGAPGAIGPQGPAGANGAVGPAGAPGAQGPAGTPGAQGPAGPQGLPGANGAPGNDGAAGPQGPAGTNGINGADGAIGPQGPAGANGAAGAQGAAGANGNDGAPGPQGAKGDTGATGPQGPAGAAGAAGAQGPVGAAGAIGATGPQGLKGDKGDTGAPGPVGATGPAGAAGASGAMGPQGPAGATGAQGPSGPPGPAGAAGNGVAAAEWLSATNVRVRIAGVSSFMAPQISTVGFTIAPIQLPLGTDPDYLQYQPAPKASFDTVRIVLQAPDQNGLAHPAIAAVETWWTANQVSLETRDVTIEVLQIPSSGQLPAVGTSVTLTDAVPTSYDSLTRILTLHVGGMLLNTLTAGKSGPYVGGLVYNLQISGQHNPAGSPSGGSTEIQVTGTGPSPMQIGKKRIAPFQVQLQSGGALLENWIQVALGGGDPYRDIVFQATVNGPVLYNFVDAFLTRVVLIGPTVLSTDLGKAPNGVALTMQPNGRQ